MPHLQCSSVSNHICSRTSNAASARGNARNYVKTELNIPTGLPIAVKHIACTSLLDFDNQCEQIFAHHTIMADCDWASYASDIDNDLFTSGNHKVYALPGPLGFPPPAACFLDGPALKKHTSFKDMEETT